MISLRQNAIKIMNRIYCNQYGEYKMDFKPPAEFIEFKEYKGKDNMRKIQNIYKCKYFTPNGNMNKTCRNEKRCCIFYEVNCKEYKEK